MELPAVLSERIRLAVETLLRASAPVIHPLLLGEKPQATHQEVYLAACRLIMRLVVVLFAEARGLLPRDRSSSWRQLLARSRRVGSRDAVSPALAALESADNAIADDTSRTILEYLTLPVDLSDLPPESLGLLYEGLLDFEPRRAPAPGGWLLVRSSGTRKGSGTFYTRPQLARSTTRRTLQPLAYNIVKEARDERTGLLEPVEWAPKRPEEILALKVCDPAMGSGAFLVSALRFLTQALLESLLLHGRLQPQAAESPERLRARLKRDVAQACLYGVDLDPVAVELARLALWVETMDSSLPLDFLDHKLKVGNALVGCWLDRFQDYPLAAWLREGDDRARFAREKVYPELIEQLRRPPQPGPGSGQERAQLRRQFDTWCAVWFWPDEHLADAPLPGNLHALPERTAHLVDELAREHRFFHWELEFPDVFTHQGSGFDAMVGNPPWDTVQVQSLEFFSHHDPLFKTYGKQQALAVQRELLRRSPEVEQSWLRHQARIKALTHWVSHAGRPFGDPGIPLTRGKENARLHSAWRRLRQERRGSADPRHPFLYQGQGKPYTYKLFLELAHALLRPGGQLGLIVPSGLYTDKGSAPLRKLFLEHCRWQWLFGLENREGIFDIHRSFKFAALIVQKGGQTEALRAAFMRRLPEEWDDPSHIAYPARYVTELSPVAHAFIEAGAQSDLTLLRELSQAGQPLLLEANPWGISHARELNMSDDSHLFHQFTPGAFSPVEPGTDGWFRGSRGELMVPLIQGATLEQFRFDGKTWAQGESGQWCWLPRTFAPRLTFQPKYLLRNRELGDRIRRHPKIVYRRVARNTDARTLIAAVVPGFPTADKTPTITCAPGYSPYALCAILNSLVFDRALRLRGGGTQVDFHIVSELPVPLPQVASQKLDSFAFRLLASSTAFAPEWLRRRESGALPRSRGWRKLWACSPFERTRLRALLDAAVAALFGLSLESFASIVADCWREPEEYARASALDARGLWRNERRLPPQHRYTVLALCAFHDVKRYGLDHLLGQNDGAGWSPPKSINLRELGFEAASNTELTLDLGPQLLDWQQGERNGWSECARHAEFIQEALGGPGTAPPGTGPGRGPARGGGSARV